MDSRNDQNGSQSTNQTSSDDCHNSGAVLKPNILTDLSLESDHHQQQDSVVSMPSTSQISDNYHFSFDQDKESHERVINANVKGYVNFTQALIPTMNKGGKVLFVSNATL